MLQPRITSREHSWEHVAIALLFAAAISYIWVARFTFQDDAFIHLRIGKNLVNQGFYSFNGDAPSFCTSSPMYTLLLGVAWSLLPLALLPKFLNVVIYVALFALIARLVLAGPTRNTRALALTFLMAVSSPLAMRWLTDGMETGLVAVISLVLAGLAASIDGRTPQYTLRQTAVAFALGVFATLLRVEFAFVIALIGISSLANIRSTRMINDSAVGLALGSAAALVLIRFVFGSFLPDTAVAKAVTTASLPTLQRFRMTIVDIGKAHGAASTLGLLVFGAWTVSTALALKSSRTRRAAALMNCGFPIFVALVILRHQAVQGYRYFVFIEFFLLAFNIRILRRVRGSQESGPHARMSGNAWASAAVVGIILAVWQLYDFQKMRMISAGRGATFERFVTSEWGFLKGRTGVAWDVGMIGFFGDGLILDGNGLVNGRILAAMTENERLQFFMSRKDVQFVFANQSQIQEVSDLLDVSRWSNRGQFDFPNFNGNVDRHYLLVRN